MIKHALENTNGDDIITSGPIYTQKILQYFAWLISIIFHPILIPLYAGYYIVCIDNHYFSGFNTAQRLMVIVRIVLNMLAFPLISVLLLKAVGFIDSIFLKTQRDRIIPYIGSGIFFFWMYLVFRNQAEIPAILTSFIFGVFLASSAALIANIYCKISMHAIGCGGLVGIFLIILYFSPSSPVTMPLMISLLISGMVCSSRMIIGSHSPKEIYMGVSVGLVSQWAAAMFLI